MENVWGVLIRGVLLGFSIASLGGSIDVLRSQHALSNGRFSGLDLATVDSIYGFIAAFGLTFMTVGQQTWIRLIDGVLFLYMDIKTLVSVLAETPASVEGRGLSGDYLST